MEAALAARDGAAWQREATRLEILSETAIAFYSVLGSQQRIEIFDDHVETLDRLSPLLQQRVDAGAASIAEVSRGQVAADLVRAEHIRDFPSRWLQQPKMARLEPEGAVGFGWLTQDLNADGALGDASLASAAIGEAILAHTAPRLAELITEMADLDVENFFQPGPLG